MARQLLIFDRLIPTQELVERIDAVTPEAIREFASTLVAGATPSVALIGAGRNGQKYARMAEQFAKL
jgi:predicted Zn-dependent peptidase